MTGPVIDRELGQLAKALAAFQLELPEVAKGETARVPTKSGGEYSYRYADLADVSKAVLPALAKQGLAWICTLTDNTLLAALVHESGEYLCSRWTIPEREFTGEKADPKAVGSWLTYGRRYLLLTMTGVHPAGEDDDGQAATSRRGGPQAGESFEQAIPRQTVPPSPLTEVITKGRQAGLTDEQIRTDLDVIAGARTHADLTGDELRPLWTTYNDMAAKRAKEAAAVGLDTGHVPSDGGLPDGTDNRDIIIPDDQRAPGQLTTEAALSSWDKDPDDRPVPEPSATAKPASTSDGGK